MSDTPISNASSFITMNYDQPVVPLYISQNLERQLADAVEDWRTNPLTRSLISQRDTAERQLAEVTKQRDALAGLLENLNDLNAMNAAEAWLKKDDPHAFACYASDLFEEHGSDVIHLSAAQRAEAFLKTLNLWKPWHTSSLC